MYTDWFDTMRDTLEAAYLQSTHPMRQSGFLGLEDYWVAARKPIADCIEHSGPFLDIGCANGYLLERVLRWTAERGLAVTPYGLDLSEKLVSLAKARLPEFQSNFYVGNSLNWESPIRFDYVRTELVYVPAELQREYVQRIRDSYLTDEGALLVAEYRSRAAVGYANPIDQVLRDWGFNVKKTVSGFWEGREVTRVAVVENRK